MIKVIEETLEAIREGYYTTPNAEIEIPDCCIAEKMNCSYLGLNSRFSKTTDIEVVNADTLEAAEILKDRGFECVSVLNMASWRVPGGGVLKGSRAQEEDLCRRTNLLSSIGVGNKYISELIEKDFVPGLYPIPKGTLLFSKDVTVFRKANTYNWMDNPFKCNVITAAAIQNPVLIGGKLSEEDREITKQTIRLIVEAAGDVLNSDALVLGALGCGAYHNPPEEIAELFKEVLIDEKDTRGIKKIVFAILDKNNTDNNLRPFRDVFNSR